MEQGDSDTVSTVLVEVDRVEDLKTAYPNYFLDVSLFIDHLNEALDPSLRAQRMAASVLAVTPLDLPVQKSVTAGGWRPNLDWMRQWSRRR
jgi:hypothetical protein